MIYLLDIVNVEMLLLLFQLWEHAAARLALLHRRCSAL